ncbi:MAG: TerB family tellurite resistance protein [Caulobacterales bacterium]|nr:TerB family tellurite resistance protein [Caulobacterales bacterium]
MGLFSGLLGKGADTALDVATAVMIPMMTAMLADGSVDDDEVRQIRSICIWSPIYARNSMERDTAIIMKAMRLVEDLGAQTACERSREFLTPALRETGFISAVRLVFADSHVGAKEQKTIENLVSWLGIDPERGRMMVEAVSIMQHPATA